jgi:hybrid cluster-associated redox disulfide protein
VGAAPSVPTVVPTAETPVDTVLAAVPGALAVFLARRMLCVGCPVNALHDLADAAREHHMPLDDLIAALTPPSARA